MQWITYKQPRYSALTLLEPWHYNFLDPVYQSSRTLFRIITKGMRNICVNTYVMEDAQGKNRHWTQQNKPQKLHDTQCCLPRNYVTVPLFQGGSLTAFVKHLYKYCTHCSLSKTVGSITKRVNVIKKKYYKI